MEVEMTDVAGGGLGRNAKDLKTGKQLTSYAEWDAAINRCMGIHSAALGGNATQSDAVVADVIKFMGLN